MSYTLPYPRRPMFAVAMCEDWSGNEYPRLFGAGGALALRGKWREGFDIHGPHAWMCRECGTVEYSEGPFYPILIQRHYSAAHGYTPALLP